MITLKWWYQVAESENLLSEEELDALSSGIEDGSVGEATQPPTDLQN